MPFTLLDSELHDTWSHSSTMKHGIYPSRSRKGRSERPFSNYYSNFKPDVVFFYVASFFSTTGTIYQKSISTAREIKVQTSLMMMLAYRQRCSLNRDRDRQMKFSSKWNYNIDYCQALLRGRHKSNFCWHS